MGVTAICDSNRESLILKVPAVSKVLHIAHLLRTVHLRRVVIRYRDDPCVNAIFLGFTDIFALEEGFMAQQYGGAQ